MTNPLGNHFTYTYDNSHNVTAAVSAENVKYTFQYDSFGNPTETKVENPNNTSQYIRSTAGYTNNGNYQTSVTDALGNTVENTYDETKGLLTKSSDAKAHDTIYTYDNMERLTSISAQVTEGFASGTTQVTYTYEDDSLKSISHNGFQYVFEEDGFGNNTGVSVAGTRLVERNYENNNGNLISETYANGYTYLYDYDEFDRVKQIRLKTSTDTESVLYRYEYDKEGNMAVEYDIREDIGKGTIVTRYFYDLSGRLVYAGTDQGESYRYVYDLNNNLTKSIRENPYRTTVTTYTYDKDSRETSSQTMAKTYSTSYDALGRVVSQTWNTDTPFATQFTYQPGAGGSQSSQVQKVTSGGAETSYSYDANGNITCIVSGDITVTYTYDELNQLIREDNSGQNQTVAYVYDTGGNIKEKRIYSYQPSTTNAVLAQATPIDTIIYGYDSVWRDKMVSYDGQSITYDALGNPISYRGMTFAWEKARELGSITKNENTYEYRYNKDGMRSHKYLPDGTVSYQMDGNLIVGEQKVNTDASTPAYELEFLYDSTGNILAMLYNGIEYYYVKNLQGDIVGILDGAGTQVASYRYDSWGKLLEIGGTNQTLAQVNPFRYRGYYYDNETGLYYLQSRYYDPVVGRFISSDSQLNVNDSILGYNLFTYCCNNPVNMVDSDGNSSLAVLLGVVLVVAAVAAAVLYPYYRYVTSGTQNRLAQSIQSYVRQKKNISNPKNQSVYVLTDSNDLDSTGSPKVKYVGRTNDIERRKKEHKNSKPSIKKDGTVIDKSKYDMKVIYTGLTKPKAIVLEQLLISTYSLKYLDNMRREIAVGNVKNYKKTIEDCIEFFVGSEVDELMNLMKE